MPDEALREASASTDEPKAEKRAIRLSPGGLVYWLQQIADDLRSLDTRLTGEIKSLDTRLAGDIRAMEERVNAHLDRVDADIKAVAGDVKSLDTKLDDKHEKLNTKLDSINNRAFGLVIAVVVGFAGVIVTLILALHH